MFGPSDFQKDESFIELLYKEYYTQHAVLQEMGHKPQNQAKTQKTLRYAKAIAFANAVLRISGTNRKFLEQGADLLYGVFAETKDDITLAGYLSRMLRLLGRYLEAVDVLKEFITTEPGEAAIADAYYNMACYYALWYGESKMEKLKQNSICLLKKAIDINPAHKQLVVKDTDFFSIKNDQEFMELLSNQQICPPTKG